VSTAGSPLLRLVEICFPYGLVAEFTAIPVNDVEELPTGIVATIVLLLLSMV
jgi:hypothetical protein